jgi:hypothetical protein
MGNCDSPGLETCPCYFTQLGTVSHRSWLRGSGFRVTGARERPDGTGESCLCRWPCGLRGAEPTSLAQLFPSHLGVSLGSPVSTCWLLPAYPVLSRNCRHPTRKNRSNNEMICTPYPPSNQPTASRFSLKNRAISGTHHDFFTAPGISENLLVNKFCQEMPTVDSLARAWQQAKPCRPRPSSWPIHPFGLDSAE